METPLLEDTLLEDPLLEEPSVDKPGALPTPAFWQACVSALLRGSVMVSTGWVSTVDSTLLAQASSLGLCPFSEGVMSDVEPI